MKLRTIPMDENYVIIFNHMMLYTKCNKKKIEEYIQRNKFREGIFGEEYTPEECIRYAAWVTYMYVEDEENLEKKVEKADEALEMLTNLKKNLGDRFGELRM